MLEFNSRNRHFRIKLEKENGLFVYPQPNTASARLLVEKSLNNQLVFSDGGNKFPSNVYVREYNPIRQCWGFAESDSTPVTAK